MEVWFADFRGETRHAIERVLTDDTSLSLTGQQSLSLPVSAGDGERRGSAARATPLFAALAGAAVVAIAAGLWWQRSRGTVAAAPLGPPSVDAPLSARVTLRVTAFPASAVIWVDGVRAQSNPFADELAVDDAWHEVVAEAPGYRTVTRRARVTQDTDIVLALEPLPAPSPPASRRVAPARRVPSPPPAPRASSPAPSASSPVPECASPYYLDARGVKKFRAECL